MQLTERHNIGKKSQYYGLLDKEAYKSKNLYNATLYAVRQKYILENTYVNYYALQHQFQSERQADYCELPAKVAQQTMKMVDQNFKAFFRATREYRLHPDKFQGRPSIPRYLDKKNGRFLLTYTKQAISKKLLEKEGLVKLSGIEVYIQTRIPYEAICQVRVVRKANSYCVEIVYEDGKEQKTVESNGRYAAIDLGVSNFATVTSNVHGFQPFIVDGRDVKSINRYYNKELAQAKSILSTRNRRKRSSNRTKRLTEKRNNKVNDFLHKASRMIVNQLVSNDIRTLIVGYNKGWKQDTNIGHVNNQNFVQLPYDKFISLLGYKCTMAGIQLITVNESHTSKCSFLDGEDICHHESYVGKRVHRGLFRTATGRLINADVNGSYNIMLKGMPKAFADGVEGVLVHPVVIKTTN